jgi:hypothetical protein
MPKKQYDKREITLIGRTKDSDDDDACEVCTEADKFLSEVVKHDNRVTYKKIEVDSEEGEEIADDKGIKEIPHIEDCKTYKEEGGKQRTRCRNISGFDEDDWSDLEKLAPKAEEKKEEKKAAVEGPEIEEPKEPSEPLE